MKAKGGSSNLENAEGAAQMEAANWLSPGGEEDLQTGPKCKAACERLRKIPARVKYRTHGQSLNTSLQLVKENKN